MKRLALLATSLAAVASFAMPASAAQQDAPCWAWDIWYCLGSTGDTIRDLLEGINA